MWYIQDFWQGFGLLVFFKSSSLMAFQFVYLTLLHIFSVVDSFAWFKMESLSKNIQDMVLDRNFLPEKSVNVRVPQGSIHGSTLFLLYINGLFLKYCYICWWSKKNLLIVDILYSRHLCTTETFLWERMKWQSNHRNKTSMWLTFYSEHLSSADIIFRFQFTLTDFSIASTPKRHMRHFLWEICIHFTLDNILHCCFKFFFNLFYFIF